MPGKHAGEPSRLQDYQRKRSFDQTPEPSGDSQPTGEPAGEPGNRFVIQEHHARSLHWDFRLERFGVLVSWAVPRGLPDTPEENRLAVHTEDHPMEYLTFEDEIPSGYGAGQVKIWDSGTYEAEKFTDDKVIVHLHGERIRGKYALFRTNKDWLIHRMDPPEPGYVPLPEPFPPMFASPSELPEDDGAWGFEVHWDGVRALASCDHGRLRLAGRDLGDLTKLYPEVSGLATALGGHRAVFDGTVVTFDPAGQPSFELLQRRMHLTSDAWIRKGRRETPVTYVVFDLLHLDGRSLLDVPYAERRRELEALELTGKHWQVPGMQVGEGGYLLEAGRQLGLPGIFAKRLDSTYSPGDRTEAWRRIPSGHRQEFVIAGWLPRDSAAGSNPEGIGALVIAYRESDGPDSGYRYAGLVDNGWDADGEHRLREKLTALPQCRNWLAGMPSTISANFVEADLVCEVTFEGWSDDGTAESPTYKGLRADKPPAEVVRENMVGP